MSIQIIADSTCDLSPEYLKNKNLMTLPLGITIDDQHYLDGETITFSELGEIMRRGIVPKTSQIPYERTHDLFESCLKSGVDVIYISFSSAMSGCFSMAKMIAQELSAQHPDRRIAVLDSKGGSGATGLIVLQALNMAEAGMPFGAIVEQVQFMADHVEHVFSIDDLEWLAKGGRIPMLVGVLGSKLGIRPILEVRKGSIVLQRMIRGKKHAITEVADRIIAKAAEFPSQLIAITHADDILSAKALEELIAKALPNCLTAISQIGSVLGAHLGLKGIGAYCFTQKPENYSLT